MQKLWLIDNSIAPNYKIKYVTKFTKNRITASKYHSYTHEEWIPYTIGLRRENAAPLQKIDAKNSSGNHLHISMGP